MPQQFDASRDGSASRRASSIVEPSLRSYWTLHVSLRITVVLIIAQVESGVPNNLDDVPRTQHYLPKVRGGCSMCACPMNQTNDCGYSPRYLAKARDICTDRVRQSERFNKIAYKDAEIRIIPVHIHDERVDKFHRRCSSTWGNSGVEVKSPSSGA